MSIKNTWQEYGSVSKWLHWSIFILIVLMLLSGNFMGDIPNKELKSLCVLLHKAFGVLIFFLTAARLAWAFMNRRPKLPGKMSKIELMLANIMKNLLYVTLLAIPVTGWLMVSAKHYSINMFGLFNFPLAPMTLNRHIGHFWHEVHELVAWTLIVLVSLHALAALKHHFYDKDNVLNSMLPKRKRTVVKTDVKKRLRKYD